MNIWLILTFILIVVIIALILPVIFARKDISTDYDTLVYNDQIAEIKRDIETGLIDISDAEALQSEALRRLTELERSDNSGGKYQDKKTFPVASIALLIIFSIPLASLGLYSYLGSPDKPDSPYSTGQLKSENKYAKKNLETLLKRLRKQLDKEPNKIKGWILLGRSLVTLGKYREASEALKHALQIDPNRPDLAASIAETKFFANQGKFSIEIRHFLNLAQRLNPREHKALYYLGLDAFNQKIYRKAMQYWVNLLSISPAQSAWINIVRERLTQAAAASNLRVSDFTPQVLGAPKKRAETIENWGPGPTKEDIEKAEQMTERERSQFIRSMVDRLAKRLIDEPNDLNGWRRLVHAYRVLGQPKKAEEAQQRVKELQK